MQKHFSGSRQLLLKLWTLLRLLLLSLLLSCQSVLNYNPIPAAISGRGIQRQMQKNLKLPSPFFIKLT